MTSPCYSCKNLRSIPGNCHISCGAAFDATDDPLAALFQLLGSVGRAPLPIANKPVTFRPETKNWPGCGAWPSAFDGNIVTDCAGYEAKP